MTSELWQRLRSARKHAGLTQQMIAEACGIERAAVSQWEADRPEKRTRPDLKNLQIFAALTGAALDWLMDDSGDGVFKPVSFVDDTTVHAPPTRLRRVPIQGNAVVGSDGFWSDLEASVGNETYPVMTADPDAFAIRIIGRRYHPAISSGQCVLIEPGAELKLGRRALVICRDGRSAIRDFHSHENGVWTFTNLLDPSDFLELRDDQVAAVQRIMSTFDTE